VFKFWRTFLEAPCVVLGAIVITVLYSCDIIILLMEVSLGIFVFLTG
jgi:hypothetical protein